MSALLIVNADDFGLDLDATDAVLRSFDAKGITSTTAMVWMADSSRAGDIAQDNRLPVGLHLNLTEPFTDPAVPSQIRDEQASLIRFFQTPARWLFNPVVQSRVESAIARQLHEFHRLYAAEPTHVDGHHHVHYTPNVLLAHSLPSGTKMRNGYTFFRGEKRLSNRLVRRALNAYLARRFATTNFFFDIRDLHPRFGSAGYRAMQNKLAFAKWASVEIMCHPNKDDEQGVVTSDEWRDCLTAFTVGSYRNLN